MKNLITQVYIKLKRAYRATLNTAKFQEILWEDFKKSFKDTKYRYGVYEEEKCVEAVFDAPNCCYSETFFFVVIPLLFSPLFHQ